MPVYKHKVRYLLTIAVLAMAAYSVLWLLAIADCRINSQGQKHRYTVASACEVWHQGEWKYHRYTRSKSDEQ